jgi:hypothetical protein
MPNDSSKDVFMPPPPRQSTRSATIAATPAAILQPRVSDQPEGKADQDRCEGLSHGRYVAFQMPEVAVPRNLFADILRLIAQLRPPSLLSTA